MQPPFSYEYTKLFADIGTRKLKTRNNTADPTKGQYLLLELPIGLYYFLNPLYELVCSLEDSNYLVSLQ